MTRQEFANLLEKEGSTIYSFCCYLTGNRDKADDLYQETMLVAIEKCGKIDKTENPKNFLIGIATRNWRNWKRKYARRQRIAPQSSIEDSENEVFHTTISPEESYISQEKYKLVRLEISVLKEKYRLPVYMYYSAEMSIEEIAAVLHIPKGTVKSRLHAARTIIKKKMEDYGYEKEF